MDEQPDVDRGDGGPEETPPRPFVDLGDDCAWNIDRELVADAGEPGRAVVVSGATR